MRGERMTILVFEDRGVGSRGVYQTLCAYLSDPPQKDAVWSSSTYYGTKSPERKLTTKEFLSIICPHIFVGIAPIIVNAGSEIDAPSELTQIAGFAGMLRGKLRRAELTELVRIIRGKRQKIGGSDRVLDLSIYDCIPDTLKSVEERQKQITFCDNFFKRHVLHRMDRSSACCPIERVTRSQKSILPGCE
jgi:hypothetical protein